MSAKKIEAVATDVHEDRLRKELARAIFDLRQYLGMPQTKFGSMMGVRQGTIVRWESGVSKPQPAYLKTMVVLSPGKIRHIFENAAKTSLPQISMDRKSRINYVVSEASTEEDLLAVILSSVNTLYLKSRGGDDEAMGWLRSIAKMLVR